LEPESDHLTLLNVYLQCELNDYRDKLVVDDVVRDVAKIVEGAAGMQVAWHPIPAVDVLSNALQLCGILEVC
jgi:hypothetical protein